MEGSNIDLAVVNVGGQDSPCALSLPLIYLRVSLSVHAAV